MNTIHIYSGRRWMGWYNQPGTYEVARRYGQLAVSRLWDALYPGPNLDPATLFKLNRAEKSMRYSYAYGAADNRNASYVARLFLKQCRALAENDDSTRQKADGTSACQRCQCCSKGEDNKNTRGSRSTAERSAAVTMVELPDTFLMTSTTIKVTPLSQPPAMLIAAFGTMFFSLAAAVGCGLIGDWPCFSMIVLGMVTNGIAHLVLGGRDRLEFCNPGPIDKIKDQRGPENERAGVLHHEDDLVVVTGPKLALRAITRGRFVLNYESSRYHNVGICSAVLSLQFLVQLLVIPQGELYGQLLFLGSLVVSCIYNTYLSSPGLEVLLRRLLIQEVLDIGPRSVPGIQADAERRRLRVPISDVMKQLPPLKGGHPARVVLAVLLLVPFTKDYTDVLSHVLDDLIPFNTPMWNLWKEEVLRHIEVHPQLRDSPASVQLKQVEFRFRPASEQSWKASYDQRCQAAQEALEAYLRL